MQPLDIHVQFSTFFKAKDLAGLMSLFHPQAIFIPGENLQPLVGKKAIAQELKKYLADTSSSIKTISSSVHCNGNLALVRSNWEITAGEERVQGMALEVLKKVGDRWLYLIDNPYGV